MKKIYTFLLMLLLVITFGLLNVNAEEVEDIVEETIEIVEISLNNEETIDTTSIDEDSAEITSIVDNEDSTEIVSTDNEEEEEGIPATLTYDKNDYNASGNMTPTAGHVGDVVTVAENSFTWKGHKFISWNTKADGSGFWYAAGSEYVLTGYNDVLYAYWIEDKNGNNKTYVINFNANGGTFQDGTTIKTNVIKQNSTVTPPAVTYNGWTLHEWNTRADGTGTPFAEKNINHGQFKDHEITFYAIWCEDKNDKKVISYTVEHIVGEEVKDTVKVSENVWGGITYPKLTVTKESIQPIEYEDYEFERMGPAETKAGDKVADGTAIKLYYKLRTYVEESDDLEEEITNDNLGEGGDTEEESDEVIEVDITPNTLLSKPPKTGFNTNIMSVIGLLSIISILGIKIVKKELN